MLDHHRRARQVEQALAAQVEIHAIPRRMAQLVGKTTAAVLINALGLPQGYLEAGSYLKSLGLNLKERSSGISLASDRHPLGSTGSLPSVRQRW